MSTPRTEPGGSAPGRSGQPPAAPARPRTETVLALIAAAAALCAATLDDAADLWILLDLAALIAAGTAVALLLRGFRLAHGRPSLGDLATGVVIASISAAVWLLARHGPQARVGSLLLATAAVMGAVLALLVLGGAALRFRRESRGGGRAASGAAPGPTSSGEASGLLAGGIAAGRAAAVTTLVAAAVAVAAALRDALLR